MSVCCIEELKTGKQKNTSVTKRREEKPAWTEAGALHVKAAPSSHIPARRKKKEGGFRATYFLKTVLPSTEPASLRPSASHGPCTKIHPQYFTGEFPTERRRAAEDLQAPDLQCTHTQR